MGDRKKTDRPNVIWVFGDQHRAQALGCSGDPNVHTPNIDNLAASGVYFNRALSGFPLCCPTRGSLLTGRYPHRCVPGHEHRLPEGQPTIADVFNEEGYSTAYFGKWHLDGYEERNGRAAFHIVPPERRGGFKHWVGYENNNSPWDCWVHGGEGDESFHYRLPGFETDELTNLLIGHIHERSLQAESGSDQPFFAVLSVQPPHNPYMAPEAFQGKHTPGKIELRPNVPPIENIRSQAGRDLAGYYAMIENLDWNLGRIRDSLREADLDFNTHIVFFSDHGDLHGSHGQFNKTSPLEEAIRVPFIIGGERPFYDRKTGTSAALLNHVDVAPTTLGLCGLEVPAWMDGTDYSSHRLPENVRTVEPDSAYLQSVIPTGHGHSVDKPWRGIITNDGWKYVCFEGISWLMFNLNEDPYELMNVAHNSVYADKRKELLGKLREWVERTGDSFLLPAN
ncbi:sulfatase family protein [Paenibacillus nasutitermitis]|uniref:Sulfatase/phosphatase n=1 Tax=Paenibacillus nasutitermitis TaxID=1652958 RepID=A0A916ZFB0_9BACL|nr:sulfatase [Paenibacillus nasutitermitis]GGD93932.1 sulfatase/phosphatase [Paenibacillus nasutitermitis]